MSRDLPAAEMWLAEGGGVVLEKTFSIKSKCGEMLVRINAVQWLMATAAGD